MGKVIKLIVSVIFAAMTMAANAAEGWIDTIDASLVKARSEKKPVLALFTGAEWCPGCIMMNKEVFQKKEFVDKAGKKFVLAFIDIPKKDLESGGEKRELAEAYKVNAYPTVILLAEEGREFERFKPLRYPTVEKMLAYLDEALEKKDME